VAKNKFSKALRHLKSTELDEKIKGLNESPTNSIGGVYALNQPGQRLSRELDPAKVFYPDVDGNWPAGIPGTPGEPNYIRPAGYWDEGPGTTAANPYDTLYTADWSYSILEDNPRNTETLIDPDTGYVRSELPPNSRSFILGPLVDLYFHNHSSDNRTYVGYVQKDTREFVLLGYVNGRWGNDNDGNLIYQDGFTSGRIWNGESSGFVATNSNFTFEMLQWFHDKLKAGLTVKNASFFNSGGVPVRSGTGGTGQPTGSVQGNAAGAGSGDASNSNDANVGSGTGGDPDIGTPQNTPNHGGPEDAQLYYTQQDPKVFANMTAGELAELGLNLLGLGLDIVAVAAIIFPEPGTSAAGLARLATRIGGRLGSGAINSARNRALRGALNPLGQRAVRSGAAGRVRRQVYSGRPYQGKRGFGKTTYGTTNRATARTYSNPGPLKGTPGTGSRVNPRGTVDTGTLPQRYIDKYGSRSVLGQKQIKLGPKAARRTFGEQFILEVATATPTVVTAPPTQEQIVKTNETADQTADAIVNTIPTDQAADLAVKAEGDAILIAANDPAVQEALDRATKYGPQSLTAEQKQILINNGYDDFVRGGMQGTDWLGDLLTLGISAAAAYALWPVIVRVGGSFINLVKTEHGMRALTDTAYKTFQTTGQMPSWYHWAFWKLFPQPLLNAFGAISGTTPAGSLLSTQGTAAGKIALHYILKPAALTAFFTALTKGDQRGAENLLRDSITDTVKQDIQSENYDLLMAMYDGIGQEAFMNLSEFYEDQKEGFNEKDARLDELYDPEYAKGIQDQIKEFDAVYSGASWEENGVRIYARSDWGAQFTKQSFESSGQSFEEYDSVREQLGFFNNDRGPNEDGRYMPLGWWQIMNAEENGHKPEQFTGIAYEIVSRSYKMDEIMKNPNYPKPGRNIYDNEADYLEASKLQDEYQKLLDEYINLWEGPGGYDEVSGKAWNFDEVSWEAMKNDARDARKRRDEFESQLDNIKKERDELTEEVFDLYDEIYQEMLIDYLMNPPETKYPTDVSYDSQKEVKPDYQEIAGLRPDGTQGPNKVGDVVPDHFGNPMKLVPRPGYGYNMWVPVKTAQKDNPNTPLGSTDPTTLATTAYETGKKKKKKKDDEEELFASYQNSGIVLSEGRRKILREIKQPYKLPEQPKQKYKMNFKGKFTAQNTPDVTASKQSDKVVTAKNAAGQTWRTNDKYWSGYESTERMNIIYDHVGHGQIYWDTIVNENQHKKNTRNREIQEHLNLIDHNKAMKEIIEQQTLDAPKDPLLKKVADKLKKQIDYPDKPARLGYPNNPPPREDELVNGQHPEHGQKSDYYKRLDPHSAEAMPATGNPKIDANIQKSVDVKRKVRKLKNILGKRG